MWKKSAREGPSCATQSGAQRRFRGFLGWVVTASCVVIAAAVDVFAADPAFATIFQLPDITYSYSVGPGLPGSFQIGYSDSNFLSPLKPVSTPVPVKYFIFTTNGGTDSGSYSLSAGANRDAVSANVAVQADANSTAEVGFELDAKTTFEFMPAPKPGANPPKSITNAKIIVRTSGGAGGCGDQATSAVASITISSPNSFAASPNASAACNDPALPNTKLFSTTITEEQLPIDEPVKIVDEASASVLAIACQTGPGVPLCLHGDVSGVAPYAYVDPTIEIDPSWAYANDFELEFSPGYAPSGSAVPEPSTWLLLASGFGALILHRGRFVAAAFGRRYRSPRRGRAVARPEVTRSPRTGPPATCSRAASLGWCRSCACGGPSLRTLC
jgi:hypothetical protein